MIASSLSVLLVAGVAVAGAWVWNGWGATLPEDVLPSSSIAFARIDLSPGLGQQMKLKSLADKFPATDGRDPVDRVVEGILSGIGLKPLTPADIEPWFDRRLGVALWSSDGTMQKACTLLALASKDEGKATAALQRVKDAARPGAFGFAHSHGYAITAKCQVKGLDGQAVVAAAIAAAGQQSLSSAADFTTATNRLGSGQLAIAYADLNAASGLFGARPDMPAYTGHFVAGLRLAGNGAEVKFRVHTNGAATGPAAATEKLAMLPASTLVGVSLDLHATAEDIRQLTGTAPSLINDMQGASGSGLDDVTSMFQSISSLAASPLTFALASLGDEPTFAITVHAANATDASKAAATLKQLAGSGNVTTSGNTVTAGSAASPKDAGTLGQSARYQAAMADAPANALLAFYADVEKIIETSELTADQKAQAKPVKAVGGAFGYDGADTVGLIRVIIE